MKINKYICSLAAFVMILFMAGCSPDEYSLGDKDLTSDDLVEGVAYSVNHDAQNPNIVVIKSLLPSNYSITFDTPQGRFQSNEVTLKIPFSGTYNVRIGAETRGGFVWGPNSVFKVNDFYAGFVNNPLWAKISGGVGKSKRWKLDIDANKITKHSDLWAGPLGFWGTDDGWSTCMLGQKGSGDNWNWTPDIAGNSWVMTAMDYGYMEFDLIDGAHVKVYNAETGKTMTGTYMLDADNHTITLSDAQLLHDSKHDALATNWSSSLKLFGLDNDRLQIAALRNNSSESPCWLCYNFVSQDYWNNWTPGNQGTTTVKPTLETGWKNLILNPTNREITYKLATEDEGDAFDYCNLDGTQKKVGLKGNDNISDATLVIYYGESLAKQTYTYTAPDGTVVKGTFTLSDDGIFTFSNGLGNTSLASSFNMSANANNTLRVLSVSHDEYNGTLKNLWLGKSCVDDQGNVIQYQGYHWVVQNAGAVKAKKYSSLLNMSDNTSWTPTTSDKVFVQGDGEYTFTVTDSRADVNVMYIQVDGLLKDHPNADIIVKSIKVDGKDVSFDDNTNIIRCIDDGTGETAKYNARRYFMNPWNLASTMDPSLFVHTTSVSITVQVVYDSGEVKIK